ncbi:MAG: PilZ domain-containing protein [bacterium]|nr:PilZ domain-containing protein [bacterium]
MTETSGPEQRLTQVPGTENADQPRRMRRAPMHGVLVAIDAPELSSEPWVVDAIDLNSNGMGLVLPPELLEGTRVLLSFKLTDHDFSRLPATVLYQMGVSGGVRFDDWPLEDRVKLLEWLAGYYESI